MICGRTAPTNAMDLNSFGAAKFVKIQCCTRHAFHGMHRKRGAGNTVNLPIKTISTA